VNRSRAIELSRIAKRSPRVLLVEDNDTNRLLARLTLEKMGCRVDEAIDGAQAVEAAAREAHDIVLMDISMPVMDGIEAARRIRASGNRTPIFALTAHMGGEFATECIAAGMNGTMLKPIDSSILRGHLAAIGEEPSRVETKPNPRAPAARMAAFDPALLDAMRAELGDESFQLVASSCRADIEHEGRIIVEALGSVASPEASERARRAAHKLVALCSTIGAEHLGEMARRIETATATPSDVLTLPIGMDEALRTFDLYVAGAKTAAAA
jgi:CheY-like chemotaxis protein